MYKYLILLFIIAIEAPAQSDFYCDLPVKNGSYALSGTGQNFVLKHDKEFNYEEIEDSLYVLKDSLGRKIINDTLKYLIAKRQGFLIAQNSRNKWAIFNNSFEPITDFEYDDLSFEWIKPTLTTIVKKGEKWGVIDEMNEILVPIKYDQINMLNSECMILKENQDYSVYFTQSYCLVSLDGGCISIPKQKQIQELDYYVYQKNNYLGLFNKNGDEILKPEYGDITLINSSNNILNLLVGKNGKYGLFNENGTPISPMVYDKIIRHNAGNSLFLLFLDKDYYQVVYNGRISKFIFSDYQQNSNNRDSLMLVRYNGLFGFYDKKKDEFISKPVYESVERFDYDKYIIKKGNKYGMMDDDKNIVLKVKYDIEPTKVKLYNHSNKKYYKIKKNGLYGYLAMDYSTVLKPKYENLYGFSEGLARVMKHKKWGYINEDFKEVIKLKFDYVAPFKNNKALVVLKGKTYFIDKNGNCIEGCN